MAPRGLEDASAPGAPPTRRFRKGTRERLEQQENTHTQTDTHTHTHTREKATGREGLCVQNYFSSRNRKGKIDFVKFLVRARVELEKERPFAV